MLVRGLNVSPLNKMKEGQLLCVKDHLFQQIQAGCLPHKQHAGFAAVHFLAAAHIIFAACWSRFSHYCSLFFSGIQTEMSVRSGESRRCCRVCCQCGETQHAKTCMVLGVCVRVCVRVGYHGHFHFWLSLRATCTASAFLQMNHFLSHTDHCDEHKHRILVFLRKLTWRLQFYILFSMDVGWNSPHPTERERRVLDEVQAVIKLLMRAVC